MFKANNRFALRAIAFFFMVPGAAYSQSGTDAALEELVVHGQGVVRDTSIGRNLLEAREMSRSVTIIEETIIDELKPKALEDVLSLSSNVSFLGDSDGRESSFVMRGFQQPPLLRDGFRVESFGGVAEPELYNLDRIEILKGPDSILYGESNPGGLVNMHIKRPLRQAHADFELQVGTQTSVSPRIDVGGGFGDSDVVRYRLVGLYSQDQGWRDFNSDNKRIFVAPSLAWQINDQALLTLLAEVTEDDFQADFGSAIGINGELLAPPEQVNNDPDDTIKRHAQSGGFDLDYRFSGEWQMELRGRVFDNGYEYSALFLPFGLDQQSLIYLRVPAQQEQLNKENALQLNISGQFDLAGLRNRLSMGIDYRDTTTENQTRFDPTTASFLDWRNPDYSEPKPVENDIPRANGFYQNDDIKRAGLFAQNHLNLSERFMFSVGIRFDDIERKPIGESTSAAQDYDNTSSQIGLRYDVSDLTSIYANYSESFAPNFVLDKNNNVLDPELGDGYELGLKGRLLNSDLDYTIAYFNITKNNVAITDFSARPTDPNPLGSIASGEQKSSGIEVDFNGSLIEGLDLMGSFGYSKTEDENGADIVGAADYTAALLAIYQLSDRWRVGAGFEYVGNRLVISDPNFDGDTSDSVFLEDHIVLNAHMAYRVDRWQYQLNISNLSDQDYIDAAWGSLSRGVHPGEKRQATVTVKYSF